MTLPLKSQFQIKAGKLDEGSIAVREIMLSAATKFNLFENTSTSSIPNTIVSLTEQGGYGFGLGSRTLNGLILVDFNPRGGDLAKLEKIKNDIRHDLGQLFTTQLTDVTEDSVSYMTFEQ